jgi:hypothetical protein
MEFNELIIVCKTENLSHLFCQCCIFDYLKNVCKNRTTVECIKCPFAHLCNATVSEDVIHYILKDEEYEKYKLLKENILI